MTANFEVRGSQKLAALGARLTAAGDRSLRREFLAGIRAGAQEIIPDIRQSALDTLPKRGGLAQRVADQSYGVQTRLAASGGRVSLVGRGMKELRDIDRGHLRHPVFGNREVWKAQEVTPGFVTNPANKHIAKIQLNISILMRHTAEAIGRGL